MMTMVPAELCKFFKSVAFLSGMLVLFSSAPANSFFSPPLHFDTLRDLWLAEQCACNDRCHVVSVLTSLPGLFQSGLWSWHVSLIHFAGADIDTVQATTAVATILAYAAYWIGIGLAFSWKTSSLALFLMHVYGNFGIASNAQWNPSLIPLPAALLTTLAARFALSQSTSLYVAAIGALTWLVLLHPVGLAHVLPVAVVVSLAGAQKLSRAFPPILMGLCSLVLRIFFAPAELTENFLATAKVMVVGGMLEAALLAPMALYMQEAFKPWHTAVLVSVVPGVVLSALIWVFHEMQPYYLESCVPGLAALVAYVACRLLRFFAGVAYEIISACTFSSMALALLSGLALLAVMVVGDAFALLHLSLCVCVFVFLVSLFGRLQSGYKQKAVGIFAALAMLEIVIEHAAHYKGGARSSLLLCVIVAVLVWHIAKFFSLIKLRFRVNFSLALFLPLVGLPLVRGTIKDLEFKDSPQSLARAKSASAFLSRLGPSLVTGGQPEVAFAIDYFQFWRSCELDTTISRHHECEFLTNPNGFRLLCAHQPPPEMLDPIQALAVPPVNRFALNRFAAFSFCGLLWAWLLFALYAATRPQRGGGHESSSPLSCSGRSQAN